MPPDILGVLEDIIEAAEYIAEDTAGVACDAFMRDRRTRQAVERNFVTIREAVNRLRRHAPEVSVRISAIARLWHSATNSVMATTGLTTPLFMAGGAGSFAGPAG